ncbi:MAG TPA: ribosome silencing factor [bacterium]|nr:ribosome silencing factor [bacterium]
MEDTVKNKVLEVADLLDEHQAENVLVLDVAETSGWTDFFIICTVRSSGHLKGLLRILKGHLGVGLMGNKSLRLPKNNLKQGWVLIDCSDFVIHLMDKETREFFELEKLWFKAELIYSSKLS